MLSSQHAETGSGYGDRAFMQVRGGKMSCSNSAHSWSDVQSSPGSHDANALLDETCEMNSDVFDQYEQTEGSPQSETGQACCSDEPRMRNTGLQPEISGSERTIEECYSANKAKRARVENIVTSIKDNPCIASSSDRIIDDSSSLKAYGEIPDFKKEVQQHRKRETAIKIRELQQQIAFLQKYRDIEIDDDLVEEKRDEDSVNRCEDWTSSSSQAVHSDFSHSQYPGWLSNRLPDKDQGNAGEVVRCQLSDLACEVFVRSIKRELTSALGSIVERSAKRIFAEIRPSLFDRDRPPYQANNSSPSDTGSRQRYSNHLIRHHDDHIELTHRSKPLLQSDLNKGHMKMMCTSSQSQMCFGDVQVRRTSNDNGSLSVPVDRNICPKFRFTDNDTSLGKAESSCRETSSNNTEDNVQSQPLSLVTRRLDRTPPDYINLSHNRVEPPLISLSNSSGTAARTLPSIQDRGNSLPARCIKHELQSFSGRQPPALISPGEHFRARDLSSSGLVSNGKPTRHHSPTSSPHTSLVPTNLRKRLPPLSLASSPNCGIKARSLISGAGFEDSLEECKKLKQRFEQGETIPSITRLNGSPKPTGLMTNNYMSDCDSVERLDSFRKSSSMQEGLTPQHLKKAKLMFFYTRYPSANTLKTYFNDVKFSRATTSQLIKWFSNFREFYYIQMEKFARQALSDGVAETNQLRVSRDSELFRVLNLHYNKSNDFRVPKEFIHAALRSLQEFFHAIKHGKDLNPSWKKVIYKIICKLDQDPPKLFTLPNVLDHLSKFRS